MYIVLNIKHCSLVWNFCIIVFSCLHHQWSSFSERTYVDIAEEILKERILKYSHNQLLICWWNGSELTLSICLLVGWVLVTNNRTFLHKFLFKYSWSLLFHINMTFCYHRLFYNQGQTTLVYSKHNLALGGDNRILQCKFATYMKCATYMQMYIQVTVVHLYVLTCALSMYVVHLHVLDVHWM